MNRWKRAAIQAAIGSVACGLLVAPAWAGTDPPDALSLTFKATTSKVLPGASGEKNSGWNCTGTIGAADQFGRLAIVSTLYQNGCYTDGRYNHGDFKVEQGVVTDASGQRRYQAYRVHGPTTKARSFLGSRHHLFYKFPASQDYTVYRFGAGAFSKVTTVPAAGADPHQFVKLDVNASAISGAVVYVVAPSVQRLSSLARVGRGVEAARILRTAIGDIYKYRYQVSGVPFDTRTGFNYGPSAHASMYSPRREFFSARRKSGGLSVVWQDQKSMAVHVTTFADDLKAHSTKTLPNPSRAILAAATGDGADCVFYVLVQGGNGARANTARAARLVKADVARGVVIKQLTLDTSKRGLNITAFGASNVGSMVYAKGTIGLIVSRTMHRSSDGLNHQGAIAVVFDAKTLAVVRNHGQTSGHSFDSVLTVNKAGQFVGIDLGDNYPRGVHLHKFDRKRRRSAIVYTFKTAHGTRAVSPAGRRYPPYAQISRNGTRYYKWSNDNRTYTELGGVVEQANGYSVVFAGEAVGGKALDNSRAKGPLTDSRNIGLVRVRSDFETLKRSGTIVPDALVLSAGPAETGGFYTFGGRWSPQRNKGVVWLTNYRDSRKANASRVKTVRLATGVIVVLWEKWTATSYVTTYVATINASGKRLAGPVDLGSAVRLSRRDEPWLRGNAVHVVVGDRVGPSLEVIQIRVK